VQPEPYIPYSRAPLPRRYDQLPKWAVNRLREREHRDEMLAELAATDRAQQALSVRLAELRHALAEQRILVFPSIDRDLVRGFRRVIRNGPAPIPPPPHNAVPLEEDAIRHTAIAVLLRAGEPLALPEIHRRLHLEGFRIEHPKPVKRLADALAYEVRVGRARRTRRGWYAAITTQPRARRLGRAVTTTPYA
jgi:hypothetical protein